MRLITLLLISATIILACNIGKNNSSLFTPDNLEASQYVINTDRDTTIETKNGALLKIPRGAMTPDDGKTVTLEIKEAYTLEQMIKGGLTTGSNGDPLSSGGMIYINAADGQNISINQKIQVAIPTDFLQKGMQLFKGKTNNKGDINWIDPVALPENKKANAIAQGEVIFQTKCAGCHAIGKELSGPDLAHFPKRIPDNEGTSMYWHHAFKKQDTPYTIADTTPARRQYLYEDIYTDQYSCNLIHMYGGKAVNLSNEFDNNLFQVYNYIQYESYRRKLELPRHAYLFDCIDSCNKYQQRLRELESQKNLLADKRNNLIIDNGPLVIKEPDSTWGVTNTPPPDWEERVDPANYDAVYYQFTIQSFGWYNIDMMMKNIDGVLESELFVRITGQYKEKIKTYLIIPSVKTYGEGGPAERNPDEFAYFYKNGNLPLPQNVKAYILAITETESSIAYGLKEFITSTKQELEVELHASSKEEFMSAMQQFDTNRLHIKVNDTKNAGEIRKIDTTLKSIGKQIKDAEQLKPTRCDCDCHILDHDTIEYSTK